jgi:hypothetical protein
VTTITTGAESASGRSKPQDRGNPAAAVPGASPREPVAQGVGNHCPKIWRRRRQNRPGAVTGNRIVPVKFTIIRSYATLTV